MKKKTHFGVALLLVFLSCLLIFSAMLAFIWNYLVEYEKTNPKNCINEYIDLISDLKYDEAMKMAEIDETKFFTSKEYGKYVKKILGSYEAINIYELSTPNKDERLFEIKGTQKSSLKFVLTKGDEVYKFGFTGYKLKQIPIETFSYTIRLPDGYMPVVDGREIDGNYLVGEAVPVASYQTLNDKSKIPNIVSYKIEGLVLEPDISIKNLDKDQYTKKDIGNSDNKTIEFTLVPAKENIKTYEQRAVDVSILYSKYVFKDTDFKTVKTNLYEETSFFKAVKDYSNRWTLDHNPPKYEDIKVKNTIEFSSEHYQTEVMFNQIITRGRIVKTYPVHYKLSFIKADGEFLLVNLEVL